MNKWAAFPAASIFAKACHHGSADFSGTFLAAVNGAINLRTDGRRAVVAYRIEKPPRPNRKWDLYVFEPGPDGKLRYTGRQEVRPRGVPG